MSSSFQLPVLPPSRRTRKQMRKPNLGLYLDRPQLEMDPRAMADCGNVRIKDGVVRNQNMGREPFPTSAAAPLNLDNQQPLLIDQFFSRAGAQSLVFGNKFDLFLFDDVALDLAYLTPRYQTGTVDNPVSNQAIVGTTTLWATDKTTLPVATSTYGNNADVGDEIFFGAIDEVDPDSTWHEIDVVTDDTNLHITTDPGVLGGATAYTIRHRFTGDNFDVWDTEVFPDAQEDDEDKYFVTNGIHMLSWDGQADQMEYFFPGFTARGFLYEKQIMMAFFIVEATENKPSAIKTSRLNFPEDYTTEEATEFQSGDTIADLKALKRLGDVVVAYYERDIALLQFVGPPIFWISRTAIPGIGLIASLAIMDFGDFHEFLSSDSAYKFDGVTLNEVAPQVFREILRKSAPNRIDRAYAHIDEEQGEVIWSIPLTTDGSDVDEGSKLAYVEHYLEDVGPNLPVPMTLRQFNATATGYFQRTSTLRFDNLSISPEHDFDKFNFAWDDRVFLASFPFNLMGLENGDIYIINTRDDNFDGTNSTGFSSFAIFPIRPVIDGRQKGMITRFEPQTIQRGGSGGYVLTIFLQTTDTPDGEDVGGTALLWDMTGTGLRYVSTRLPGRFVRPFYLTSGASQPWDLAGHAQEAVPIGER